MAFDLLSALGGGLVVVVVFAILAFVLISLLFGKVRTQLKFVLEKLFSKTSLMLIAIFDVVAAFDPTQTLLGLGVAVVAGLVVFLSQWGFANKFDKKALLKSLVEGFIGGIIIAIPMPIAGLFVAWFGLVEAKKGKA